MASFTRDPNSVLDFVSDWSAWLDEDTIDTSVWIAPAWTLGDVVIDSESHTDTTATIWLSGGVVGKTYPLVNRITTAEGRTDDRTIRFTTRER